MAVFSRNLIIRCGLSSSFSAVNHGTTTTCMAFPRSAIEVSVPWVALVGLLFSADGPEVTLSPCPAFEFACSLCCRLKTGLAVVFFSVDFPRAGASSGSSWDYILTYSSMWCKVKGQLEKKRSTQWSVWNKDYRDHAFSRYFQGRRHPVKLSRKDRLVEYATVDVQLMIEILLRLLL